ncbi:heterokaryon incompatibility protein-domain-containing protein, partial [Lasiosphaeria ovina]
MGSTPSPIVFLAKDDDGTTETPHGFGRLVQPQIPPDLLRRWLYTCEKHHHAECRPLPLRFGPVPGRVNQPLRFLRAIDVREERLVEITAPERYVALSYVWGRAPSFRLLRSNLARLYEPRGLGTIQSELSQTVKDAMRLVALMGERYLWIDALCLVQDDGQDMAHGIENMDIIYEGALATVIAANGKDQNSGLTGIRYDVERLAQQPVREVVPGVELAVFTGGMSEYLGTTHYSSRGWTMQEQVLSRRCLIFVDGRIFFRCHAARFSEDTIWDQHPMQARPEDPSGASIATPFLPESIPDPVGAYLEQVLRFTGRHLTKPDDDAVRALSGILTRLAVAASSGLLCGLLTSAFDVCLLFWHPSFWQQGFRDVRRRPTFPSWCWAGWAG